MLKLSALVFPIILISLSFFAGYRFATNKTTAVTTAATAKATNFYQATKSDRPEIKFFVMSFCPYGNQIEDTLKPIFDLLGDKVNFQPQYIFNKIDNLTNFCQGNSTCLDEKSYIKSSSGAYFASLHGRQEANQDVREICANSLTSDKKLWWSFVKNINKNCNPQNADDCWEQEAKKANLDTTKITECFNTQAIDLIEKETTASTKYNVTSSPTVFINDVAFPPLSSYAQDGKGTLQIGKKTATQDKYRTPNVLKEAICTSFKNAPKECDTILPELSGAQPGTGECAK